MTIFRVREFSSLHFFAYVLDEPITIQLGAEHEFVKDRNVGKSRWGLKLCEGELELPKQGSQHLAILRFLPILPIDATFRM